MFAKASLWLAADKGIDALARAMGAIAEDTSQTKLTMDFRVCRQLSDISSIGGGLEKLVSLQQLTMDFQYCAKELSGLEALNDVLEGMFGEGIDTDSNEVMYKQSRAVAEGGAADNAACATTVDKDTSNN